MIQCIKTGAQIFLEEYGTWVYGDAFEADDFFIFRVGSQSFTPEASRKHFQINLIAHWFDQDVDGRYGTLIAYAQNVTNLGYDGVPIDV